MDTERQLINVTQEQLYAYLKSLDRHIRAVQEAGKRIGVDPVLLGKHDYSKYSEEELTPYAKRFYTSDGSIRKQHDVSFYIEKRFDAAWLHHIHHNPHHWQHWLLQYDSGTFKALEMPVNYIEEMVADWMGASYAYTDSWDMTEWLNKNLSKIVMNPISGRMLKNILYLVEDEHGNKPYMFVEELSIRSE